MKYQTIKTAIDLFNCHVDVMSLEEAHANLQSFLRTEIELNTAGHRIFRKDFPAHNENSNPVRIVANRAQDGEVSAICYEI